MRTPFAVALTTVLVFLGLAASAAAQGYDQQVRTLAGAIDEKLAAAGKKTVAVVDFTDLDGNASWLGRFLAEEVSVALASESRGLEVIERTQLRIILQEQKLGATGIIDPQTARKLGQIAGADAIVTGTLTPFGDSVRLSVKALDVSTARMIAASVADIPKTKAIEELLARDVAGTGAQGNPGTTSAGRSGGRVVAPPAAGITDSSCGIRFSVQDCSRSGTALLCRLSALAGSEDLTVEFSSWGDPPTAAWDNAGNQSQTQSLRVGNQDWRGTLVAGVPTPVTLNLTGASLGATAIARLTLNFRVSGQNCISTLRNIPLQ